MKVAFFSTHDFDQQYFEAYNIHQNQYTYLECSINENTIELAKDHDVVCAFANDKINNRVIKKIADLNIKLIALRCAGFNNVDIEAANFYNVTIPEFKNETQII
jgi:D-lactate dehydrogenase